MPANLDPHQVYDVPMQGIMLNAYDNLYRYENDPPQIVPWLTAKQTHTVSDDGLSWEFEFKPGVKFHDGSALTADDVVYSFRRVLALALAPAGAFLKILKPENVTAVDPLTVRFKLETSYAPFFAAIPSISIVNPRAIEPNVKIQRLGARAGWPPTALARVPTRSSRPAIGRWNIRHGDQRGHFLGWGDNPKPVKKIALRPVKETSTRILALLNGTIDCTDTNMPADQVGRSTSPRSPICRRTLSCGPSCSA